MKPLVSVIVPVYNVAGYLPRCLDSLVNQTLRDIEIIVVNDGSSDRSADVMDRYATMDSRIQVIHQENQGLSGARNTGLAAARGDWISFVDSDDWVEPAMLENMYRRMEETGADLCACDFSMAYDNKIEPAALGLSPMVVRIDDWGIDRYWLEKRFSVVVWNKLYKRSILDAHGIRFEPKGEIFSEDVLFNLYYLRHTGLVASLPGSYYYYYQRSSSLMNSAKPDYLRKELTLVEKFRSYYATYHNKEKTDNILAGLLFDRVLDNCMYKLSSNGKTRGIRSDLAYASKHDYFYPSMRKIMRDRGTWLPLRGFALLNAYGLFGLSSCYLTAYYQATRVKKALSKSAV